MTKYLYLTLLLVFPAFWGCGPSDEDRARVFLTTARQLLEQNDTVNALLYIDSVALRFPKAAFSVNAAKNLKNEIVWELLQQRQREFDTIKVTIERLERNFNQEKTAFDRYTQYNHKRQTFQRSWNRSYIQVHLDERGEISLSSNYHGEQWLDHVGLRVYDQGDQAQTDTIPIGHTDNHRSDFMEAKWEKVTYRNGRDNGVIEFIATHTARRLKAVFLGKRYHYIVLEDFDKRAVLEAYQLSQAIKRRAALETEIKNLQNSLSVQ